MQAKHWPSLDQKHYLVDATKVYFVRGKIRSVVFVGKQKAAKLSKTRGANTNSPVTTFNES